MISTLVALLGFHAIWQLLKYLNIPTKAATKFIGLLAYTQLILAPWLFYQHFQGSDLANLYDLNMQIDDLTYFRFLIPAYIALTYGMVRGSRKIKSLEISSSLHDIKVASKQLLVIGLLADILLTLTTVPQEVVFALSLAKNLIFGALITLHILYIKETSSHRFSGLLSPYSLILILLLVRNAASAGMFGEMIFLLLLFAVMTFDHTKPNWTRQISLFLAGTCFVASIQLTKNTYREMVWRSTGTASLSQLYISFQTSVRHFGEFMDNEALWFSTLSRMNQGFLVSHVISKCERDNILLQGEKSLESIAAAVVPRILWPDKPMAGGRDNIKKYTNKVLVGSTSMNISYFGDFYIDFGPEGGVLALFVFGYLIGVSIAYVVYLATIRPVFFVGLPLILSGMVQVETDLLMIVNHFAKSLIFYAGLDWMMTRSKKTESFDSSHNLVPTR